MHRLILLLFIIPLFNSSCKEEITFTTESEDSVLVVNGYISNMSFSDYTNSGLADGRFFAVDVNYSKEINTYQDSPASGSHVQLVSSTGDTLIYSETEEGHYELYLPQFKAEPNIDYQLQVSTREDETFFSEWVKIPEGTNQIDRLDYQRGSSEVYYYVQGERFSEVVDVLDIRVSVPDQANTTKSYYVWDFDPSWVFEAPLQGVGHPFKRCWVTDYEYYLDDFALKQQNQVAFTQSLFEVQIGANEKMLHDMTVLVSQQLISEEYFVYLEEVQKQLERGTIFDSPPYNLRTNIHTEGNRKTAGFFSVTNETIERIYMNQRDLNYYDDTSYYGICDYQPPRVCFICTAYPKGKPSNQKPWWWR